MKDAAEFLQEEEGKPVFYHVYGYYDKDLDRYNTPFISENEPNICIEQVKASVVKDVKNQFKFKSLVFAYYGKFDIIHGEFVLEKEPIALLDIDKVLEKVSAVNEA